MTSVRKKKASQPWQHTSIIPAPRRLKKEDHDFKARLDYIVSWKPASAT